MCGAVLCLNAKLRWLMPSFSVVILHHNKAAYSHACLESLLLSTARPLQVVNVDNGSRDETSQVLAEWQQKAEALGIRCRTLNFDSNLGAVQGRNEAVKVAEGDLLAFLDNDTLISQADWLERLAAHLETIPNCALVTPKLLFPWEPFAIECCGAAVSPQGRIRYLGRGKARHQVNQAREIQCAISAAWLMSRQVWESVGPLDDAFSPVQYEDLDWCYRARDRGLTVWTAPDVEIFHFEHTTTAGSDDINFRYVTTKNGILFKKRWGATFEGEHGTSESDAQWQTLPKKKIEEIDWRALLPVAHPSE